MDRKFNFAILEIAKYAWAVIVAIVFFFGIKSCEKEREKYKDGVHQNVKLDSNGEWFITTRRLSIGYHKVDRCKSNEIDSVMAFRLKEAKVSLDTVQLLKDGYSMKEIKTFQKQTY